MKCNDTLAIIPTAGGKSICFQAPSIFFEGITIVISPLIALIKDQVYDLNKRFQKPIAIFPGMNNRSDLDMLEFIQWKHCKFLYLSPERLNREKFLRAFFEKQIPVDHVVIDEVHSLSQWGFDFRESYIQEGAENRTVHRYAKAARPIG